MECPQSVYHSKTEKIMRNFIYNNIQGITICTALPTEKAEKNESKKSVAVFEQTTSDLGFSAAQEIITSKEIDVNEIGALIFLTKTPDYRGPATAMVLQNRLEIPKNCIVYDSPTGNAGFESGLNLGASLLNSITQNYALIVFGDTISKQLNKEDISELPFQDGATAILLEKGEANSPVSMSTLALSEKWTSFMLPSGGFRKNDTFFNQLSSKRENQTAEHLHLDAQKVYDSIQPELSSIKNKIGTLISNSDNTDIAIIINLMTPALENELQSLLKSEDYAKDVFLSSEHITQTMASTVPLMIEKIAFEKKKSPIQIISVSLGEGLCINVSSLEINKSSVLETINSDEFYDNGYVTHEM